MISTQTSPITAYVYAVRRSLHGPRRARIDLIEELTDGLRDAAEAHRQAGLTRVDAEQRAVAESGTVAEVAAAIQPELIAKQGRRTAMLLALGMPGLVLLWDVPWKIGGPWSTATPPATLLLSDIVTWIGLSVGVVGLLAVLGLSLGARLSIPTAVVTRSLGVLGAAALAFTMVASVGMGFANPAEAMGAFMSSWIGLSVMTATLLAVPALTFSVVRSIKVVPS
ncbi:permease prefix domain 1-containing protein [Tenggerimyces flavus]|uniref:Permease prefix domain 1-containing protein n=1 Tax=Tenggerimyces flavus TaxID=1708749 RepID=A0ABV7YC97_9ACTN|nr:permease prefix domain 1-containing protein [Tenggerimyces flavus]MBM7786920.1 hypothetical protein [Tenggerimyces flavus]